jgi:hypothetical protein
MTAGKRPSPEAVAAAVKKLQAELEAAAPAIGAVMELPAEMDCPACGSADLAVRVNTLRSGTWASLPLHLRPGSTSMTVCSGWSRRLLPPPAAGGGQ